MSRFDEEDHKEIVKEEPEEPIVKIRKEKRKKKRVITPSNNQYIPKKILEKMKKKN